jgi:hypothetical protein
MNDKKKPPKLGSLTDEIAQEAVLGWLEGLAPQKPYAAFGFRTDPFIYTSPEVTSLVKTSDLLAGVRRIMGHFSDFYSKKAAITDAESYKGHHMLVLGASDSGRTYLLEFAHVGISEITIPNLGNLNLFYIDAEKDWKFNGNEAIKKTTKTTEDDETSKYQQFTGWLSEHEDTLQQVAILFIDNIASVADIFDYIVDQLLQCGTTPLLVASLSLAELEWIKKTGLESFLTYFNKLPFYLNPFQDHEFLVELLKNRIKAAGMKNNIFSEESLHTIAYLSFGLPGLAIWLASEALTHTYNMKEKNVSRAIVLHVAKQLGFDAATQLLKRFTGPTAQHLILHSVLQAAGEARAKLGRGRNRDYAVFFGGGITNTKLQGTPIIGTRSKSTISHHLKVLYEDKNFLNVQKKGKSRIYFLERPVLNALELISCPRFPSVSASGVKNTE